MIRIYFQALINMGKQLVLVLVSVIQEKQSTGYNNHHINHNYHKNCSAVTPGPPDESLGPSFDFFWGSSEGEGEDGLPQPPCIGGCYLGSTSLARGAGRLLLPRLQFPPRRRIRGPVHAESSPRLLGTAGYRVSWNRTRKRQRFWRWPPEPPGTGTLLYSDWGQPCPEI